MGSLHSSPFTIAASFITGTSSIVITAIVAVDRHSRRDRLDHSFIIDKIIDYNDHYCRRSLLCRHGFICCICDASDCSTFHHNHHLRLNQRSSLRSISALLSTAGTFYLTFCRACYLGSLCHLLATSLNHHYQTDHHNHQLPHYDLLTNLHSCLERKCYHHHKSHRTHLTHFDQSSGHLDHRKTRQVDYRNLAHRTLHLVPQVFL